MKIYEKYFCNEVEIDDPKQNEREVCEKSSQKDENLSFYDSIGKKIGMQESFSLASYIFN